MKNVKIWLKMALGIGILLLFVVLNGGLSIQTLRGIDEQVTAIATVYSPLANQASRMETRLKDVPAAMNLYLYNGEQQFWQATDTALVDTGKLVDELARTIYSLENYDNSLADRLKNVFSVYEKTLRDTYTANEEFNKTRSQMVLAGEEALDAVKKFKADLINRRENYSNNGDILNVAALNTRIEILDKTQEDVSTLQRGILRSLAAKKREYSKDNLGVLFPKVLEQVDLLQRILVDPKNTTFVDAVRKEVAEYRTLQSSILQLWTHADEMTTERETKRRAVLATAAEIANISSNNQAKTLENVVAATESSMTVTGIVCLVITLLGLVVGVGMTRVITVPVLKTLRFAQSVAGGALDQRLRLDQKDEIGQLSVALDSMVDSLNEKINESNNKSLIAGQKEAEALKSMQRAEEAGTEARSKTTAMLAAADRLEEVANILSSATNELSAQIEQSERGASEQASRVTETATGMEEMNSTVVEVARNAGAASDVSAQTREKAEQGAGIVQKAVTSIQTVQREALALKEDMATLGSHAQSISQIMGVISDIADQTNLLALNAAIEAARAGEAGRGFAVVADEVRKLAEKTMTSTIDVGNAIKSIQNSATKSMDQVDRAGRAIEEATGFVNESGVALEEIVKMADQTADQVRAIATASEQQSASSEEINQSISQVNIIAGETARAMEEAARAVSDLADQAQVLTHLIDEMKRG